MPDGFDKTAQSGEQFSLSSAGELAWRQEVASRLDNYRTRKTRTAQERSQKHSMSLDFEPVIPAEPKERRGRCDKRRVPAAMRNLPPEPGQLTQEYESRGHENQDDQNEDVAERPPLSHEQPADRVAPDASRSVREDNVLQFPRSALNPVFCEELAEPVQQTPRILDVPEELELAAAPLVDIGLAPLHDLIAEPDALRLELPLPVASTGRRASASLIDMLIVLGGGALFTGLLARWGVEFPPSSLGIAIGVAIVAVFWISYEYLFLVYSGDTPGMLVMDLGLTSLGDQRISRSSRKWRVLGMMLSYFPLGLGVAWAFFDEDGLCWHDRISHTYLRMEYPSQQPSAAEHPVSMGA
jgi:uncharacterized RDD family membrane protein YckC